MGNSQHPYLDNQEYALRTLANVVVVASAEHARHLSAQVEADALPGFTVVEGPADMAVPDLALTAADVLILEVEPGDRQSMSRLSAIRSNYPALTVVAAIGDSSVALVRTLVRQGVADVVALPFDTDELVQSVLDAVAARDLAAAGNQVLAPMVAVVRAIGGSGATSIATHLAAELARDDTTGRGVAIVDLDLQFGSVSDYLGTSGRGSLADLLEAGDRLDEELLNSIARWTPDRVAVIAAPDAIMPLESVDIDQLLRVLSLIRQRFAHVVLDLPANWTNWTLSAALAADGVVLVTELSVGSLRQAKRRLDLFASVGIDRREIRIVVNRVEKRLFRTIGVDDVAATLGHPVLTTIALEEPLVSSAQDQGQLAQSLQRKSKFAADVARLAAMLRSDLMSRSVR